MNIFFNDWFSLFDDSELDELDCYLCVYVEDDSLLLDGVYGLFFVLVVGLMLVMFEEWLFEVLYYLFVDEVEGNCVFVLLVKFNDFIEVELDVDVYELIFGEIDIDLGLVFSVVGWCEGFSCGIDLCVGLWEKCLVEDLELMELFGLVMVLVVDEGIFNVEIEFEKFSDEEYDECLVQVLVVLGVVSQYWQEYLVIEVELDVVVKVDVVDSEEVVVLLCYCSGYWVY